MKSSTDSEMPRLLAEIERDSDVVRNGVLVEMVEHLFPRSDEHRLRLSTS